MPDQRIVFCKTGRARYISHLDLMRTFQRAFLRAGISVRHTEGFNPHAYVSILLPLSVGFSSECELLEFGLPDGADCASVPKRLTKALPEGIEVLSCSDAGKPVRELQYVNYIITLEYDAGTPIGAENAVKALLSRESLVMAKRSKKAKSGAVQVDLIPLIHKVDLEGRRDAIVINALLKAQNPGLNPALIVEAIQKECPQAAPDYVSYHRKQILDRDLNVFQ